MLMPPYQGSSYVPNGRHRAPSNPVSPSSSFTAPFHTPIRRQGSYHADGNRTRSHSSLDNHYPSDFQSPGYPESPSPDHQLYNHSGNGRNTIPMPASPHDTDEEDNADQIPERMSVSSLASLNQEDHIIALQQTLKDVRKKAVEAERNLQEDLAVREQELVDLQARLDRRTEELAAKTRDEKELRNKEVGDMSSKQERGPVLICLC